MTAVNAPAPARRWWALGLIAAAQFMVIMDTSIIAVALPEMQVALGFGQDAGEHTTAQRRWLALTIEDDGGRDAENGVPAEGSGLGLIGIRERVMALGGTLDVIDLGDKGFKLHAMIPFEAPAEPPP